MSEEHTINLQPGTVIGGKYEVVACLGSGSMGSVYACKNQVLQGQLVAVKVLFSEVASDKVASARFKNEILASYEVSHPNVVRAYEYITDRNLVAYTMEYVGGGDLASKLDSDQRMSISEIVRLLSQMSAGCQAIHDAGIVHRDLKPENILLTADGNVKIADFGIARNRHGPKLTEHGGVVGTIDYVAPEYMLKSQVDWRSDIYALGILAYEMVTGESPFKGESVYATMTKRLKTDPQPPSALRSECPHELDRIILKAMQRDPESRYQASIDMFNDLQQLVKDIGLDDAKAQPHGKPARAAIPPQRRGPSVDLVSGERLDVASGSNAEGASVHAGAAYSSDQGAGGRGDVSTTVAGTSRASGERARSGDTAVLSEVLTPASVEADVMTGSPYSASEPLVSSDSALRSKGKVDDFRFSRTKERPRRTVENESNWGEVVALVFAAAVGIGCGFMFLKLFAPSLLAKWNL
ncbi:MAG: serine/threonine-protein kinase PrkC [Pseudomonadota bacterium]|jgi:serine/threonine protein kinase